MRSTEPLLIAQSFRASLALIAIAVGISRRTLQLSLPSLLLQFGS